MKDNYIIALCGLAAKWIDLFSADRLITRDYCLTVFNCYGWTYSEWYEYFPEGRDIMQTDYNYTIEFIRSLQN